MPKKKTKLHIVYPTTIYEAKLFNEFVNKLSSFQDAMVIKFLEGRKKYHNKLSEIDFEKEIKMEVMDLIIYKMMEDINKEGILNNK